MICPACESSHVIKKGISSNGLEAEKRQRYKCHDCSATFYIPLAELSEDVLVSQISPSYKKYVITSAQNDTSLNMDFVNSLIVYCNHHNAELMVLPNTYDATTADATYPDAIKGFLMSDNIKLHPKLKVLGALNVVATSVNPLSGLSMVSKGDSVIIGHPQVQFTSLPTQPDEMSIIMTTTGSVSNRNYLDTKAGYKAEFNHSHSAVVVEIDGDIFHIRHLNFDGEGFYDFELYFSAKGVKDGDGIEAIVTGDEHAMFSDPEVQKATYGMDGIVETLSPSVIVRHDLLDCYSVSHHHRNNAFIKFKKFSEGTNNIKDELSLTADYLATTTPNGAMNIIVSSNHNDHLAKWLSECDISTEPWNAIQYHWFMWKSLSAISEGHPIPNMFELWLDAYRELWREDVDYKFVSRTESYKICDIELAMHGDKGLNGARGSRASFSTLPEKCIIGHSHSPGIEKGVYQVGTSSVKRMEYNDGPSSWMHTHCLIYPNGKRQLVNIINGKWRV